ncbi:MAG: hypothetical protein Q8L45_02275 [Xanthomonadaceae bacterium]|nr:hypothetical protein [Xanthomonadaceae bacterium]MDP2186219.1 hypothetical protein [Xanthomonadales bacterium]MDZ4117015.1 hypothetical protein [Xanthomonadaceae bacterium]MDZ4378554.1 hypothetical protein [Xanthomonadaceae bacterium]
MALMKVTPMKDTPMKDTLMKSRITRTIDPLHEAADGFLCVLGVLARAHGVLAKNVDFCTPTLADEPQIKKAR